MSNNDDGKNNFDNADSSTEEIAWDEIDFDRLNDKLMKIKTNLGSAQSSDFSNFPQKEDALNSLTYDSESHFSKMMINEGNYHSEKVEASTFKILKRPDNGNKVIDNLPKTKIPLKSLKQREKEYAEARLRILGSAINPDDAKTTDNLSSKADQQGAPNQEEMNRVLRMPEGPAEGSNGFKVRR